MCGITGHYHFNKNQQISDSEIRLSLDQLKKRGPDNQTTFIAPGIGLGHARLKIIDMSSAANQPMNDPTGRYTIVFNGEIFNYRQLRSELRLSDSITSDTEVLLHAYIRWQHKCLDKLNGFFAFCIYDKETHSIFAARDRFGIKPFLYSMEESSFYFASELKALAQYPIDNHLSNSAINNFFHLSYLPNEQSIFEKVMRLPPGYYLTLKSGTLSLHCYYDVATKPSKISFNESKEKLFSLVNNATDQWLISDAPLGAFLSGGIDSSIVVAMASQKVAGLKTFAVTFPDSQFHNEGPFAKLIANKYKTDHHEIPLTQENLYNSVDLVLEYLDEPFADTSAIPSFALCDQVGKHVRVALSGDGADEIFGGYQKHKAQLISQRLQRLPLPFQLISKITETLPQSRDRGWSNKLRQIHKLFSGLSLNERQRYFQWCSFTPEQTLKQLFKNTNNSQAHLFDWSHSLLFPNEDHFTGLNKTLYRDTKMVLPGDMLYKVDMMSMANSIEVRPLLLDHHIVDFAFSLPDDMKINKNQSKFLLLETFKHLLPEAIYNRPKHGFTVELMLFFRQQFWEKINDIYLNDRLIKEQGLFSLEKIQQLKKDIQSANEKDIQTLIWQLITFQNFYLKYKPRIST